MHNNKAATVAAAFPCDCILIIYSARKSDFPQYKKSYMLTGKMFDILRIRLFLLYGSESAYLMS